MNKINEEIKQAIRTSRLRELLRKEFSEEAVDKIIYALQVRFNC